MRSVQRNRYAGQRGCLRRGDKLDTSDDPKQYRRYAEEYRRLADNFESVEDKTTLLNLTQVWDQLADQAGDDGPKLDQSGHANNRAILRNASHRMAVRDLDQARWLIAAWVAHYNTARPHSSKSSTVSRNFSEYSATRSMIMFATVPRVFRIAPAFPGSREDDVK
jgi:Integrase core domain